jgi:hypothetical protein
VANQMAWDARGRAGNAPARRPRLQRRGGRESAVRSAQRSARQRCVLRARRDGRRLGRNDAALGRLGGARRQHGGHLRE